MRVRFASGLFRLWVAFSVVWLAAAGAYPALAYQEVVPPDLKNGRMFDDLVPRYEYCWDYRTSDGTKVDRKDMGDSALMLIAECERAVDRWFILRNGTLIALCVPIIVFCLGWGFVWAFRGFLPVQKP
jgi:hypothetical protein